MTPKDILTNRHFCPMPWTGLMYNFDGKVKNCIRSAAPLGNIKDSSIHDILTGESNCDTQTRMLDNLPGKNCYTCYDLERNKTGFNIISDRVFYIRELKHTPLDTYKVGNHKLETIDVRWNNLCNFACVYCSPEFSSRWANELSIQPAQPSQDQIDNFKKYIFDHASNLKHVYLAGGEPLLMKENLELLEILKTTNPDVNVRVNTNLSKVDTRVFEEVCKFKNVHWTISVETIEQEFEYIRYGGAWKDFVENLSTIQQLNHKVSFNMLYFLLNYKSLFGCVEYLQGRGFHNNSFIIGALLSPLYWNIRHLPDSVLSTVEHELVKRISEHPGYLLEDSYKNLLHYIKQPFDKDFAGSLAKIQTLDQRRNIDSKKIFTDLYSISY